MYPFWENWRAWEIFTESFRHWGVSEKVAQSSLQIRLYSVANMPTSCNSVRFKWINFAFGQSLERVLRHSIPFITVDLFVILILEVAQMRSLTQSLKRSIGPMASNAYWVIQNIQLLLDRRTVWCVLICHYGKKKHDNWLDYVCHGFVMEISWVSKPKVV